MILAIWLNWALPTMGSAAGCPDCMVQKMDDNTVIEPETLVV
jgi:hypothetical protein